MRRFQLILFAATALSASPALAGKKEDDLAACMWEKMPRSAEKFLVAESPRSESEGLFEGLGVCGHGNLAVNTKTLRKRLQITRPAVIAQNSEAPVVFTCMKAGDGKCEPTE